jgi:hypothetical protein
LDTRQGEVLRVAALTGGAEAEEGGAVADDGDADVGLPGRVDGRVDAAAIDLLDGAALFVRDASAGQFRGEGVQQGAGLDAVVVAGVVRQDVVGEGVAAEEGVGVVGARADEAMDRVSAARGRRPSRLTSRTMLCSASSRAMARCAGGSRSMGSSPGTSGEKSASSSPSSTFCRSTRRTARSTSASETLPSRTRWARGSP